MIKSALKEKMLKTIKENGNQKSKTLYYLNNKKELTAGKRAPYMDILSRREASTIFAARTRMIDVKLTTETNTWTQNAAYATRMKRHKNMSWKTAVK